MGSLLRFVHALTLMTGARDKCGAVVVLFEATCMVAVHVALAAMGLVVFLGGSVFVFG